MNTNNFFKLQVCTLIFAAIIFPLSALAGSNSKQATIEFALGTYEVLNYQKSSCLPYYLGGSITGIGTGSITEKGKSESLRLLSMTADDCITPLSESHFTSEGNLTLSANKSDTITAHYSTSFSPTINPNDDPNLFEYSDFKITITGGTGRFKEVSGSGTADGLSHIVSGLGFVEGIINISK
jgi:hypothetical protein